MLNSPVPLVLVPEADIDRLIAEDVGFGDLTTTALGIGDAAAVIGFAARHKLVACATEEAARVFVRLGAQARVLVPSGTQAEPGTVTAGGNRAGGFAACRVEGGAESRSNGPRVSPARCTTSSWRRRR